MCETCWEEAGAPMIHFDGDQELAALIRECPFLPALIEDYNLGNDAINSDIANTLEREGELMPSVFDDFLLILNKLLSLTEPQRYSVMALADGYWTTEP